MPNKAQILSFPVGQVPPEALLDLKDIIIVTIAEWDGIQRRGRKLCLHRWVYRKSRSLGEFKIIHDDHVDVANLPAGRKCDKCGKIEWCAEREGTEPWKQLDLTPKT